MYGSCHFPAKKVTFSI